MAFYPNPDSIPSTPPFGKMGRPDRPCAGREVDPPDDGDHPNAAPSDATKRECAAGRYGAPDATHTHDPV